MSNTNLIKRLRSDNLLYRITYFKKVDAVKFLRNINLSHSVLQNYEKQIDLVNFTF